MIDSVANSQFAPNGLFNPFNPFMLNFWAYRPLVLARIASSFTIRNKLL